MRVVVYFPPNLVGLKMSDCTVAIARKLSKSQHSIVAVVLSYSSQIAVLHAIALLLSRMAAAATAKVQRPLSNL